MKGISYYPAENNGLLRDNCADFFMSINGKNKTFNQMWDEFKNDIVGDDSFLVHLDLYDSCKETIEQIKRGSLTHDYFMYRPQKFFDLLCQYYYIHNNYKNTDRPELDISTLHFFVRNIVSKGANIEEMKKYILAGALFNVDTMIDNVNGDYTILESKMRFSNGMMKYLDGLKTASPYEIVFQDTMQLHSSVDESTKRVNMKKYSEDFTQYDLKMLQNIAQSKISNYFLNSILAYRYSKDLPKAMNNPLAKQIFEIRKPYADNYKRAKGVFIYSLKDDIKEELAKLIRNSDIKGLYTDALNFYDYGFTSKRELREFDSAVQVLHNCLDRMKAQEDYNERV